MMVISVVITLDYIGPEGAPDRRTVTLSDSVRSLDIGRSSGSTGKGLMPGPSNLWFQSPIVSRQHARISIDPDLVCEIRILLNTVA